MTKRQQRALKIAAQQALTDAARQGQRELNAEEQAQFDELQREIDELTLQIEAEERAAGSIAQPAAPAPAQPQATAPTPTQPAVPEAGQRGLDDPVQITQRAIAEERQRVAQITDLCRNFDMDPGEHIREGRTIEQVRAAVLDSLMKSGQPVSVKVTRDESDTFCQRATDALLLRAGVNVENPVEGSGELRSLSLRDLAIECFSREGRSTSELLRMDNDSLYGEAVRQFYNPSAAFPAIMDQTIRKSIVTLYNEVPTTFQAITTKGSLKDFKTTADHEYVIGGVGDFLLVPENGEIKPDMPRTEVLPQRKLDTYGKSFSMTRQAFINDDIGFLTEVPGVYAAAAKKTIDKAVYSILFNNADFADHKPLFHADHKNLVSTGSKPSQSSIQNMLIMMQMQQDHFGQAIYITPRTIIVPIGYEFDLKVIFHSTQVTGSSNNDVNPLYNYPLQIVQTPVLNAMAGSGACPWFMQGQGARGIQVDYLNGQETPTVRRMETPGTLGFTWDIYLDWGISIRDYRSLVRNNGVKL